MFYSNAQIDPVNDYTYDALYRLIKAKGREKNDTVSFGSGDNWNNSPFLGSYSGSGTVAIHNYEQQYSYDAVGNILQLKHIAPPPSPGNAAYSYTRDYEYYGNNNRLRRTTVDGGNSYYSYSHHAEHGFITALPHLPIMTWNFKEELVTSGRTSSSSVIPEKTYYQYDSKGKRLRKVTENQAALNSTPTLKNSRTYIEGYEFYKDYGSNEITHSLSLIDQGHRFVMVEDSNTYGYLVRYQHPNHQSSSSLETDATGNVISYEEYHPFGTTAFQATNSTITSKAKRYRYTGMERDEETGLNYHNARYYISWLGRWLNPDPIGIGDGVNVYAYCQNSPVVNVDKEGTQVMRDNLFKAEKQLSFIYNTLTNLPTFKNLTARFNSPAPPQIGEPLQTWGLVYPVRDAAGGVAATTYFDNKEKDPKYLEGKSGQVTRFKVFAVLGPDYKPFGTLKYSNLTLAFTLLHEAFHANIGSYLDGKKDLIGLEKAFPGFSQYLEKYKDRELSEHEYIAVKMRDVIAKGLEEFDRAIGNVERSPEYYQAMAWDGLIFYKDPITDTTKETSAWINFKKENPQQAEAITKILLSDELKPEFKKIE